MLTETETEMLELERTRWKHPGAKDAAIVERFGLTPTRYYAALHRLIERPDALAYDPSTVGRLLRLRERRRAARAA